MSADKEAEAAAEALPSYDSTTAGPSAAERQQQQQQQPSVEAPFNFPTDAPPSYAHATPIERPVAVPQTRPDAAAPFVAAYAPSLQAYGVPADTWHAFVRTINAFLTASVGDQAVSHAADMARHVGHVPKRFGKATAHHARDVGHSIAAKARAGNYVGAGLGVLAGAVSLPVGTALRAVGAAVQLPLAAVNAVAAKPRTPRERATAYVGAANKDWFHPRHLHAAILDTAELARLVSAADGAAAPTGPDALLARAAEQRAAGPAAQLSVLGRWLAPLEMGPGAADVPLTLSLTSLWLVITHGLEPAPEGATKK